MDGERRHAASRSPKSLPSVYDQFILIKSEKIELVVRIRERGNKYSSLKEYANSQQGKKDREEFRLVEKKYRQLTAEVEPTQSSRVDTRTAPVASGGVKDTKEPRQAPAKVLSTAQPLVIQHAAVVIQHAADTNETDTNDEKKKDELMKGVRTIDPKYPNVKFINKPDFNLNGDPSRQMIKAGKKSGLIAPGKRIRFEFTNSIFKYGHITILKRVKIWIRLDGDSQDYDQQFFMEDPHLQLIENDKSPAAQPIRYSESGKDTYRADYNELYDDYDDDAQENTWNGDFDYDRFSQSCAEIGIY